MAKVFKYPISAAGESFELRIKGFQDIVHVGEDGNGTPCIWAQVNNPNKHAEESLQFMLVATGQEFDADAWCHVRSFVQGNGLVWHLLRPFDKAPATTSATLCYFVAPARPDGTLPLVTDDDVLHRRTFKTFNEAKEARDTAQVSSQYDLRIYSLYAITQQETTFEVPF